MPDVTLTVDGQEVTAREGETILEVARRLGKSIPTLCHDPRLEPFTSCFVCLVELEGRPGFVPSCATKVAPNMKVLTGSPAVRNARKMALELLMSAHEGDCVAPCRLECPANIDIQTYIANIAAGEYGEALKTIKRTNPFPSVCGRVCPHPCELQCRRQLVDESVAINPLKRFVADLDRLAGKPYVPPVAPDTGKRIAIIGSGPAGMTTAYFLRQMGHAVTVFEKNEKAGGMLRYGIPRYRLPDDVLDQEIEQILSLGVELRTNQMLGRDFDLSELHESYDAVFIGIGAWSSMQLGVPGEDIPGVMAGIDFLCRVAAGERPNIGNKVVVVGGGNTAIDAARTARRLGAEVTVVYRRGRDEMPAEPYEVAEAEEEGVALQFLAAPVAVESDNGRVGRLHAVRMELGEPDASGRRRPVPVEGSDFAIEADTVIAAIGQRTDRSCVLEGPEFARSGTVQCVPGTHQTNVPWIFAAGDCASGTATAIQAIGGGRRAALSIDHYLRGEDIPVQGKPWSDSLGSLDQLDDSLYPGIKRAARLSTTPTDAEERVCSFAEVEHTIDEDQALAESRRCLECGCVAVDTCSLRRYSQEYDANPDRFEAEFRHRPISKSHPLIVVDPNKCIVCGRCVRICYEQQGLGALGFVDRGFETTVKPGLGEPLLQTVCDACGQCIGSCPTGALTAKRPLPKIGPYYGERTPVACGFCGIGCELTLETTHGRFVEAVTEPDAGHNRGNLCVDGKFGHRYLETLPRLVKPTVLRQGQPTEATWDEALSAAADGLSRARAGRGVAVLVNGPLTNEDAYVLARLARTTLTTASIAALDGPAEPMALAEALRPQASRVGLGDLLAADTIWLIGADPFKYAPIAGIEMLRAAVAGVPVTVIAATTTRLDEAAERVLRASAASQTALLRAMAEAASGDSAALDFAGEATGISGTRLAETLSALLQAERPVIVCQDDMPADTARALAALLQAAAISDRLLLLRRGGNARGREWMGLHPALLPGGLSADDPAARRAVAEAWGRNATLGAGQELGDLLTALRAGELDAAIIVNTDPYGLPVDLASLAPPVFTVALSLTPADAADVALPVPGLAESAGTVLTLDGTPLATAAARKPVGGRSMYEVLAALADALGEPLPWGSVEDARIEAASFLPEATTAETTAA